MLSAMRTFRGVLFGLLVVAGAQLAINAHLHEHTLSYPGEFCEVCLKFERLDDVAMDAQWASLAPESPLRILENRPVSPQSLDDPPYHSRSPPIFF